MPIFPLVEDAAPVPVATDVLTHETAHTGLALAKLLSQYKRKPRIAALVSAFTDQCQELEDVLWDLLTKRTIDGSEGIQLDNIGKIVGQPRLGLDDEDYRIFLRVRIRLNFSNGTPEDMLAIAGLLGLNVELDEQYPAAVAIKVNQDLEADPALLLSLFRQGDPVGVLTVLEYLEVNPSLAFVFGDSANPSTSTTQGFGDTTDPAIGGSLASVIR